MTNYPRSEDYYLVTFNDGSGHWKSHSTDAVATMLAADGLVEKVEHITVQVEVLDVTEVFGHTNQDFLARMKQSEREVREQMEGG